MRGTITDLIEKSNELVTIFVNFNCQSENENPIAITRSIISQGIVLDHKMIVKQFPLRLAWDVTAQKAHGQTLNKVAISLNSNSLAHGAFYVAMSRVRKHENILLFGKEFPKYGIQFHTNKEIRQMEVELDEEAN